MFKIGRTDRATLYGWIILLLIPMIVMGWTIGRYGPGSDDWAMLNRFYHGVFTSWDAPRPLHSYSHALVFLVAGGRVPVIEGLYFLLEGLAAALYFETLRRIFRHWLGSAGIFAALLTTLVYVLYPSYADRLWLIMIQDTTNRVLTAGIALLWVIGSEKDQPRYGFVATVLMLVNVLHKENSILVFGLFPLILLFFDRPIFRGKWRRATAVWFGAVGGYLIWHNLPARLGGVADVQRSIHFVSLAGLINFYAESLANLTYGAYENAYLKNLSALQQMGDGWLLPAALAGAALVVTGGWLASRQALSEVGKPISLRRWAFLFGFGAAVMVLGLAPFYLLLGVPVPNESVESRNGSVAMMGASLMLGLAVMLPMIWYRFSAAFADRSGSSPASGNRGPRSRAIGLVIAGLLGAFLLAAGAIRQYRLDKAFIEAWEIQRAYWQRTMEAGLSIHPNSLIVMDNFPRFHDEAPLAAQSWGYIGAFQTLYADVPSDILAINSGDVSHVEIVGDHVIITRYGTETNYPMDNIRVLSYDSDTHIVQLIPYLPARWTYERTYVYSGDNSPDVAQPSQYASTLLGPPVAAEACQTRVPVSTRDQAPFDGVVEVASYPSNQVLDRRPVTQGSPLNFSFMAPCGLWIRVYFVPDGGAGGPSWARLISQYGPTVEFGTDTVAATVSYATAFSQAAPVQSLH